MTPREQRIKVFEDTMQWLKDDDYLSSSIDLAKKNTEVFYEDEYPALPIRAVVDTEITVTGERSFQAAMRLSKENPGAKGFYEYMHGEDWEKIVDNDTSAIAKHAEAIKDFYHKPLTELKADILLTGSKEEKFMYSIADDYYENVYGAIIQKVPKAKMHLFEHGDHPAMLSDFEEFYGLSMDFFGV